MFSLTSVVESAILFFHVTSGSWAISIAMLALTIKIVLFPVHLFNFRQQRRMSKIQPELDRLSALHKGEPMILFKKISEMKRREGVKTGWNILASLIQIPLFLSIYRVFSGQMALFTGNFAWIASFAAPDPFYVFPLLVAGGSYLQQRLSCKALVNSNTDMNRVAKWMPVLSFIFMIGLPSSLTFYYAVSGFLNILSDYGFRKWA